MSSCTVKFVGAMSSILSRTPSTTSLNWPEDDDESGRGIKVSVRYDADGCIFYIKLNSSECSNGVSEFDSKVFVPTNFTAQAITISCESCEMQVSQTISSQPIFIPFTLKVEMPETKLSSFEKHPCLDEFDDNVGIEVHLRRRFNNTVMLLKILEEAQFSDVALRVEGQELPAHRAVLAASSPVFRAMFQYKDFAENKLGVVDVQGVRVEVMQAALQFLYGQRLAHTELDFLLDLLELAERYQLEQLKTQCEFLLSSVKNENLLKVLVVADTHNASYLKDKLLRRFADHSFKTSLMSRDAALKLAATHRELFVDLVFKSFSRN